MKRLGFGILTILSVCVLGGGSKINNGAGVVENNVIYSYLALPKLIQSCFELRQACQLTSSEAHVLQLISKIPESYPLTDERLEFVSEASHPGFFQTSQDETHRLAMTGDRPGDKTYWNRDQFYEGNGQPALDLAMITSIWTHELGHQTGQMDHGFLDQVGSRMRWHLQSHKVELGFYPANIPLKMTVINYPGAVAQADLLIHNLDTVVSFSSYFIEHSTCNNGDQLVGWTLWNMHWGDFAMKPKAYSVEVEGTVFYRCLKSNSSLYEQPLVFQETVEFEL